MNLTPIGTKVVVRKIKNRPLSETIILDATVEERETGYALVIAAGTGVVLQNGDKIPLDVAPGDMVLLPPYVGAPYTEDGTEYHIVESTDIMAVDNGRDDV